MRTNLRKIGIKGILLLVLMMMSGCCQEQPKERVEITQDFVPMTEIKDDNPNVYVIVKSMTSSYWQVVLDGTKQAGIDYGCNIYAAGKKGCFLGRFNL